MTFQGGIFMVAIEKIQNEIIEKMATSLNNEQLIQLENVLSIVFHGIEVKEECTELVTSERHWSKILNIFIASKRVENCAEGTLERYRDCVTKMITTLNKRFEDITTNDVRYYLAMYQEQRGISISYMDTIRRYLHSFFEWLTDEEYISRNPLRRLRKIKVPQTIKKPFSQAEMEHLKSNVKCQRDLAIIEFLYSTAGRIGEVVRLNKSDIDWNNKEVVIYGEKGKKERKVYLTDECAYHLKKYLDGRNDYNDALFVSNKQPCTRLGKQAIQSMLRELGKKTNIHVHPHKFRRTMLSDQGKKGIPLQEIQMYAGHCKPDTTMMYVSVSEESVKASFRRYMS